MSNDLAISAVTATLKNLLTPAITGMASPKLSVQPLDKARKDDQTNQLNIFLYHAQINGAWRNQEIPRQTRPNETGRAPLPLNLYYLITAYGKADMDLLAHRILGRAVSILHDHPRLTAGDIQSAIAAASSDIDLSEADLQSQVECVRLTWHPLSLEEMSKLWGGLQTQFRLSAAYEASVVLIESTLPSRTPLPVLQRGAGDHGVDAQASLISPYPAIDGLVLTQMPVAPGQQDTPMPDKITSPLPGDLLTIQGHHLSGSSVRAIFKSPRPDIPDVVRAVEAGGTDERLTVSLATGETWFAGYYTVAVRLTRPGDTFERETNELAISIAPTIASILPANPPPRDVDGNVPLKVSCSLDVLPSQRVSLLFADREVPSQVRSATTKSLDFTIVQPAPGDYLPRLRVDGVDSPVVDRRVTPLAFDRTHQVTIA